MKSKQPLDMLADRIYTPALIELFEHWCSVRGKRKMPSWQDIDPLHFISALPMVFAWRYDISTSEFVGRLIGDKLGGIHGQRIRGVPMKEYLSDTTYPGVYIRSQEVVTRPGVFHDVGLIVSHAGRLHEGERLILPVSDNGSDADGILGAVHYDLGRAYDQAQIRLETDKPLLVHL